MLGVVLEALGGGLRGTLAPKVSQDSKSEANIGSLAVLGPPRETIFGSFLDQKSEHVIKIILKRT